jgi:hypothetical protein
MESQACLDFPERGGEGGEASNGWPKAGVLNLKKRTKTQESMF